MVKVDQVAEEIAKKAHKGQKDKAGKDYFSSHLSFVANSLSNPLQRAIGFLHDVIEDTEYTKETLYNELIVKGVDELEADIVVSTVDILSRKENESYNSYIKKIKNNSLARIVKIADMKHNSDLSRLETTNDEDIKRTNKYKDKIKFLESI